MNRVANNAERFLWNNLRMYLMLYPTCLLDNLLEIVDGTSDDPFVRYKDFPRSLDRHIGLGSYTNTQPTQFSTLPHITVNIMPIAGDNCNTRVVIDFDVVFATDTPSTTSTGNTNEAIAAFRANILDSLDQIMYDATDQVHYESVPFFTRLRDQDIVNPLNKSASRKWQFNIVGQVDAKNEISEVSQLKREDRSSGISVFSAIYTMDMNRIYSDSIDCGC